MTILSAISTKGKKTRRRENDSSSGFVHCSLTVHEDNKQNINSATLRLVFTNDESQSESQSGRKSAYDQVKIKDRSRKRSHKLDGIGVGRIRTFPFSSDSAYDSVAYDPVKNRLSESEAEAEEPTNHKAWNRALCASDSDNAVISE